jgi:hypothetical protein
MTPLDAIRAFAEKAIVLRWPDAENYASMANETLDPYGSLKEFAIQASERWDEHHRYLAGLMEEHRRAIGPRRDELSVEIRNLIDDSFASQK